MRVFSEFDKKIIKKMQSLEENDSLISLMNFFESALPDGCYIDMRDKTKVNLVIATDGSEGFRTFDQIRNEVVSKSISVALLLKHLEENKLIFLHGKLKTETIGIKLANIHEFKGFDYEKTDFLPEEIKSDLYKFSQTEFYITESLKQLVRNNFKSPEELRHEKELNEANKQHYLQLEATETLHDKQMEAAQTFHDHQVEEAKQLHAQEMDSARNQMRISRNSFYVSLIAVVVAVAVPKYVTNDINITNKELAEITHYKELNKTIQSLISNQEATKRKLNDISSKLEEQIALVKIHDTSVKAISNQINEVSKSVIKTKE